MKEDKDKKLSIHPPIQYSDINTEETVIKYVVRKAELIDKYKALSGDMFVDPFFNQVYSVALDLHMAGIEPTKDNIFNIAKKKKFDIIIQNEEKLSNLYEGTLKDDFSILFDTLKKMYIGRELYKSLTSGIFKLTSETIDNIDKSYLELQKELNNVYSMETTDISTVKDMLKGYEKEYDSYQKDPTSFVGAMTGYPTLDNKTLGIRNGEIMVVGARPGTGKTSLLLNMAINMAKNNHPVALLSLEMSLDQITHRLLSIYCEVNHTKIRSFNPEVKQEIDEKKKEFVKLPLYVDATQDIDELSISKQIYYLKRRYGVKVIFIDYLQLIRHTNTRVNDNKRIADIMLEIRLAANKIGVGIVLAAQLNRMSEIDNRKPNLHDLRDSGAIEQDSNIITFLHVDWKNIDKNNNLDREISFYMAKNRSGGLFTTILDFHLTTQKMVESPQCLSNEQDESDIVDANL